MTIGPFEQSAVSFLSAATSVAEERLASLIPASPLSARNPDVCLLWHDGYREKHRGRLFAELMAGACLGFLKGAAKLAVDYEPFRYALHGKTAGSLLVAPSHCGRAAPDGTYKTAYVRTEDEDGLFVFGPAGTCGRGERDARGPAAESKLSVALGLLRVGARAFLRAEGGLADRSLLLLLWLEWTGSLQWLYARRLEQALSRVVEEGRVKKIGCTHEMHFHARVVWQVAARHEARSYAVQHASISPGKKWYFSYPEERAHGLKLPDVMHVFDRGTAELLRPHFDRTEFVLGCSSRYARWKAPPAVRGQGGGYYLFVSGLAAFDNDVVVEGLRRLVEGSARPPSVRLRLHHHAQVGAGDRAWIEAQLRRGLIGASQDIPLQDDIGRAKAVIGMSTTVLEEALLLGCPVVQLTHPEYLRYMDLRGIAGASMVGCHDLSAGYLDGVAGQEVDRASMRDRLGLDQPTVTYARLFEP